MVCFCWNTPSISRKDIEEYERNKMFESAFTYNTDYNYNNNYNIWGKKNYYTKTPADEEAKIDELKPNSPIEILFIGLSFLAFICTLPFSLIFSLKFVNDFERLVVLRLGKAQKVRGPGTFLVLPCIDKSVKVNIDVNSYELPNINVITIDKGLAEFSSTVFTKVTDPVISHCNFQDKDTTIKNLSYSALYKFISKRSLYDVTNPEVLSKILKNVQEELNKFTADMGVEIVEVTVTKINVHKEAENQAIAVFNKLVKSEIGSTVFKQFQDHLMQNCTPSNQTIPVQVPTKDEQVKTSVPKVDTDIEELIFKIRKCCDMNLVNKVQKRYRIVCFGDDQQICGDFVVDLKEKEGWATWTVHATDLLNDVDVSFSLSKQSLFALLKGELTPLQAYMNGLVQISGSISDATSLKHLMDKAREIRCI